MTNAEPVLDMKGIYKRFGTVTALKNVDLTLYKCEILGLIGENGAGKSTLMKIIAGSIRKDAGTMVIGDKELDFTDTREAKEHGIGMIFQELSVFMDLTAAQNIFITQEIKNGPFRALRQKEMNRIAEEILKKELGVYINPKTLASDLSLGQRQSLEIARALVQKKNIIIMDEPTAALERNERENLFSVVRRLKEGGTSIIFITHHLDEIMSVCDRVIVLRDGNKIDDLEIENLDTNRMIELMIGKTLKQQYPKEEMKIGDTVLKVNDLSKKNHFNDINFELKQCEILGFAGLEGCGKNEIFRCLYGDLKYDKGEIFVNNRKLKNKGILNTINKKIVFLPADRKTEGLFLIQDVKWNTTIATLKSLGKIKINKNKENSLFDRFVDLLKIKISDRNQIVKNLSGGNQQKVMLARWLMTEPEIILMDDPTRGIDVNAKTEVYKLITKAVKSGKSVCIISSEGPELLGMCDRIIVVTEGEISKVLDPKTTTEQELTYYITKNKDGAKNEDKA